MSSEKFQYKSKLIFMTDTMHLVNRRSRLFYWNYKDFNKAIDGTSLYKSAIYRLKKGTIA